MENVPRFHTCSVPRCGRPSERNCGGCDICNRYMCFSHSSPWFHQCRHEAIWHSRRQAEFDRLRSLMDDTAVCRYASSLNGGRKCRVEHPATARDAMVGTANYHARVRFSDGSPSWLIRVPRVARMAAYPDALIDYLIVSEYATLKFLEPTAVPAPKAFGYGIRGAETDHGVGVSFILMEELPGKPWDYGGIPEDDATKHERAKLWKGLANVLAELAKHPLPKAGSLRLSPEGGGLEVGPVASDRFMVLDPFGPFERAIDYYTAWAEQYLALIADGQLYAEHPVDAYLVYRFLKENAWQLVQDDDDHATETTPASKQQQQQFFMKHVDDVGHHLLVDDDLNITGIIDWQMARAVPPREAFGPSLVTVDCSTMIRGPVGLTVRDVAVADALRERGSPELARWSCDEKARRFFWGLGLEDEWSYSLAEAQAILEAFGVHQDWAAWRTMALKRYSKTDKRLRRLRVLERASSTRSSPYNLRERPGKVGSGLGAK
ncbi:hypothetical protein C8A01DRAFT_47264 [Parachaetomium inaequale]|uniref:Aminoglycoside phosphotransferase domain-containing protein n=1 Tax=Parachaetomium inaequale TaxID=2588326 RepID=A0AAN6PFV8_9PEZI|nr:hypothetical protein C8A01DRAFT_47264 [Parachaetomium inaequale]